MMKAVSDILAQIVEEKRANLPRVDAAMERAAEHAISTRRDFARALRRTAPAIIAEIKKASPSKGLIAENFDPVELARAYERGGAAALSVLTDQGHFQGSLADLTAARGSVDLPVLRKDFTISEAHVIEAAAHGADAVLLIAAVLSDDLLRNLRERAAQYKMSTLVEVHDGEELSRAIDSGAEIIGVNNRDLRTFEVRIETSLQLAAEIPSHTIKVAESGIRCAEDIAKLSAAGFHAFLVGEHLMRSSNPSQALEALLA